MAKTNCETVRAFSAFLYPRLVSWITCEVLSLGRQTLALDSKYQTNSLEDVFCHPFYWQLFGWLPRATELILDLGAQCGHFSLLAEPAYILIEPNPKLVKVIRRNLPIRPLPAPPRSSGVGRWPSQWLRCALGFAQKLPQRQPESRPKNRRCGGGVFRPGDAPKMPAHVLVLPTLSDGFAVTQLEAIAHGLPVVTTPNCGNVVTDGMDGFIVPPPRDSQALADVLARFDDDRPLLSAMSGNTLLTIQKYDLPSDAGMIPDLVSQHRAAGGKQTMVATPTY
jgi:hypothetical protein